MDEHDNNVRRIGHQDRKEQLEPVSPLFPAGETDPLPAASDDDEAADVLTFLTDANPDEGLEVLASLPPHVLRLNAITPAEERFPPLAPPTPKPKSRPRPRAVQPPAKPRRTGLYNTITLVAVVGTFVCLGVFALLWREPQSWLNPFPPVPQFVYVTATPGNAPAPTLVATLAPAPLVIDAQGYPFAMTDAILYAPNGNGLGCKWGSIAGSITARDGSPLDGYRVRMIGNGLDEVTFSGAAVTFGPGGYEMPLGSVPQTADYTVQLFSPQGAPLSPAYPLTTQAACEQNVAVLNFHQAP